MVRIHRTGIITSQFPCHRLSFLASLKILATLIGFNWDKPVVTKQTVQYLFDRRNQHLIMWICILQRNN